MAEGFFTIESECEHRFTEKKSEFISHAYYVENESDIENAMNRLKLQEPEATHHCYAYILKNGNRRFSDAGEPSGTAGMPILSVIEKQKLSNVLVTVTRYFGGIKLGAGGLVRAYSNAAAEVLKKAGRAEFVLGVRGSIEAEYKNLIPLERMMQKMDCNIEDKTFGTGVRLIISTKTPWQDIINVAEDTCSGSVICEYIQDLYIKKWQKN